MKDGEVKQNYFVYKVLKPKEAIKQKTTFCVWLPGRCNVVAKVICMFISIFAMQLLRVMRDG